MAERNVRWLCATIALLLAACGSSRHGAGDARMAEDGAITTNDASSIDSGDPVRADSGGVPNDVGPRPANVCATEGGCPAGVWINVTPAEVDLGIDFGVKYVMADARHPERFYAMIMSHGLWRSDDYGQTWSLISTGTLGDEIYGCSGGISIPPNNTADPPTIYAACVRSALPSGIGFFRSTNGGIDWEHFPIAQSTDQQFNYRPVIDPYDPLHLLMTGHGNPLVIESIDGGEHWNEVITTTEMRANGLGGGSGDMAFIDTGDPTTTRSTWLWLSSQSDVGGTWRTTDSGDHWTKVETNEHINGGFQLYQPDTRGVVYMGGVYSDQGWGILRSEDYGEHWIHVGSTRLQEAIVFGTANNVYAMYGWAIGAGGIVDPSLQVATQPGTGEWTTPGTPPEMTQGPAQAAVSHDGEHAIIVIGSYNAGLWRYIEP